MDTLTYAGFFIIAALALFAVSQYISFNLPLGLILSIVPVFSAARLSLPYLNGIIVLFSAVVLFAIIANLYIRGLLGIGKNLTKAPPSIKGKKTALLTFDDGPSRCWTGPVLDLLEREKIRAVFFVVGKDAEKHRDIMEKMVESGQEIGVHSYSHKPLIMLSAGSLKKEMDLTLKALDDAGCKAPRFFRPPWGLYNRQVIEMAKERGLKTMLWNWSAKDWTGAGPREIVARTLKGADADRIFLFHDGHREGACRKATVEALPEIIAALREKGFEFADPAISEVNGPPPANL